MYEDRPGVNEPELFWTISDMLLLTMVIQMEHSIMEYKEQYDELIFRKYASNSLKMLQSRTNLFGKPQIR